MDSPAAEWQRRDDYLKGEDLFRRNARIIIEEMLELSNETEEDITVLVDEVLHSIFFLGEITQPSFSPESIVTDEDMRSALKDCYPEAFNLYSTQLPKRSPFSCVLDMVVHLKGENNEMEIKAKLRMLVHELQSGAAEKCLFSTTICVSHINIQDSVRYYGVSMSTFGRNPGKIMVAASCFSTWDDYVAGAVMTYYPDKNKKSYIDGTIILPEDVRCQAFNLSNGREMPPCKSCVILFGLQATKTNQWPYGNCAEVESVSNLLKNESKVKEQVRPTSNLWTDENRQRAKDDVLKRLRSLLKEVGFKWDGEFYTPRDKC